MKFVEQKVELWDYDNPIDHIARCARICYASDKTTNNEQFVEALRKNMHRSMFRHVGVYYIIPEKLRLPFSAYIDANVLLINDKYYVSVNEQAAEEYWDRWYDKYKISKEEAENNEVFYKYKMLRYTFCIDTSIAITREYNRKSPNNIAEQSTRYVDFNKKLGIRFLKSHWMYNLNWYKNCLVWFMAKCIEWFYKISRSKFGLNLRPEDARWILALDVMSKVAYTYTVADWEYIINLRYFNLTGKAHNDAEIVAEFIKELLEEKGYKIDNYNEILEGIEGHPI